KMIGQTISHYRILEKLGEGGMGKVYLADDTRLERKVALKFLPREQTADEAANRRFEREAHATARLSHPNIITIHEINEIQGRHYIVSEYIAGGTLKEKIIVIKEQIESHRRLRDILVIALQIGRGLQKAHEAGIIHRDIKPANILIDTDGQVKIADFGLARLSNATSKMSKEQSTAGTAMYMAPEQIIGGKIDQRADIWSFGVVLFEMINGSPPFKEEFLQALFYSIINDSPPPLEDLPSHLSTDLEKIVSRCLAKEADERYQTMTEVLTDLKLVKHKLTNEKDSVKKTGKVLPLLRRRKKFVLPAVFLSLIILFILIPNPGRNTLKKLLVNSKLPARKYLAVLPLVNSGKTLIQKAYCNGTTARIITKLTGLEEFQKKFWVEPIVKRKDFNINNIQNDGHLFSVTLALTGNIQFDQNKVTHVFNLTDSKTGRKLRTRFLSNHITDLSNLQDGIIRELVEMLDVEWDPEIEKSLTSGGTSMPGAFQLYLQGLGFLRQETNIESINEAIEMFNQAIRQDDSYDEVYSSLGYAYLCAYKLTGEKSRLEKAEYFCTRSLEINKKLYTAHITLGLIHNEGGNHKDAIIDFQNALDINPECFQASLEIALTYFFDMDEKKKAEEAFKKAIAVRDEYWKGYKHLGYFYFRANRSSEAEKEFLRVIDLNPADIWTYKVLFGIYNKRTDEISSQKAREIFEKSKQFGTDGEIYSNMGTNLFLQKQYAEARNMYIKALEMGKNSPRLFMI
ncbi:MAG: protein kinase, partial [Candidatus Aminicenantes bacterium]|nr:protein kinase [Candidatus Aminicenantes bacterium]